MFSPLVLLLVVHLAAANNGSINPTNPSGISDILKTCWRKTFDFRCLEKSLVRTLRSISDQEHYQLFDVVSLDKTSEKKSSSRAMKGGGIGEILGELIETRSLGIVLPGGQYAIRAHRAADDPEQMELAIEPKALEQGRNRIAKMMIPLVLGFKITGVIIVVLTLVKMFLFKALLVSKIALMATLHLLTKKIISSMMHSNQAYIYDSHSMGSLDHQEGGYSSHDIAYTPYHMGGGHTGVLAQGSSPLGYAALYPSAHPPAIRVSETTTSDDDLQGEFSNDEATYVKSPNAKNDTQPIHVTRKNFAAGVDSYSDYSSYYGNAVDNGYSYGAAAHRTPVMAYKKAITTGRSTDGTQANAIA